MKSKGEKKFNASSESNFTESLIINILGAVIIINILIIGFIAIKTTKRENNTAGKVAMHYSESIAIDAKIYINQAIETVNTLGNTLTSFRESGKINRNEISELLQQVLKNNSEYLAAWTLWEENAFDAKDKEYRNTESFMHTEGRMNIAFYKDGNTIKQRIGRIADYQQEFYLESAINGKQMVKEPYKCSFSNEENNIVLMTSIILPIIENSKFLGVICLNVNLDHLSVLVANTDLYKTGKASIITSNLQIAAHQDHNLLGKDFSTRLIANASESISSVTEGVEFITYDETHDNLLRTFTPLYFNNIDKPWSVMTEIPLDEINVEMRSLLIFMGIIVFLSIATITVIILLSNSKEEQENKENAILQLISYFNSEAENPIAVKISNAKPKVKTINYRKTED